MGLNIFIFDSFIAFNYLNKLFYIFLEFNSFIKYSEYLKSIIKYSIFLEYKTGKE
jgi:hypothetical protein